MRRTKESGRQELVSVQADDTKGLGSIQLMRHRSFSGSLIARSQSVWLQSRLASAPKGRIHATRAKERSITRRRNQSARPRVGAPSARSSSLGARVRFNWGVKLAPRVKQHRLHHRYCIRERCYFSRVHSPRSVFALILCKFAAAVLAGGARAPSICIFISSLMENVNTHYSEI